jgi:hypothetical protein
MSPACKPARRTALEFLGTRSSRLQLFGKPSAPEPTPNGSGPLQQTDRAVRRYAMDHDRMLEARNRTAALASFVPWKT